jgi:hypothetical protein
MHHQTLPYLWELGKGLDWHRALYNPTFNYTKCKAIYRKKIPVISDRDGGGAGWNPISARQIDQVCK